MGFLKWKGSQMPTDSIISATIIMVGLGIFLIGLGLAVVGIGIVGLSAAIHELVIVWILDVLISAALILLKKLTGIIPPPQP